MNLMNEEIEIGEYCRFKNGTIAKVTEIIDNECVWFDNTIYYDWGEPIDFLSFDKLKGYIIKHSKNIIDLIEVDDYVNGSRVLKINCKLEYIDDDMDAGVNEVDKGIELEIGWIYFESEIKSIVTKEQFKEMEYKVEE